MNIGEMLASAWDSLSANKLRAFLTMLGILIGVASIIAIVAIGQGGKSAIIDVIESQRAQQTVEILPKEVVQPGLPQPGQVLSFSDEDFFIARQFHGVADVSYTLSGQGNVAFRDKAVNTSIEGGPNDLNDLANFDVVTGRMFTSIDVLAHRRVGVVSHSLAQKLFGNDASAIGQVVKVGGQPVQVVGVAVSNQFNLLATFFGSDYLYMPATTCKDLFPWWNISEMDVLVTPGTDKADLARRIVTALNIHAHNADAFIDSSGFLVGIEKTVGTVTSILTLVIGAVAGIALIVGGVGVMNIMLVSVTERTEEIGIRMSLGATRAAILVQFLLESVMITVMGGAIGILLGISASWLIHWFTPLPSVVSWQAVVIGFFFSVVIGVLCGLYPANKASKLNPIDALRYE
ncbi:ABC transporter permease [Alicyclobacillus pomorum]|uniref:ABC transporter permease n=1 Tax=Alicyclobacillus pomorum TaxID=204470 RepID=UPI0003F4C053|nr:ABC transporter permease [Alicyclobacillus pomorum]